MKTSKMKELVLTKMTDNELSSIVSMIKSNKHPQINGLVEIVLREVCRRVDTKNKILLDLQNMVVDKFSKRYNL